MRLKIIFKSLFMEEDSLVLSGADNTEIREKFVTWWEKYGKNEEEAMETIHYTEKINDN